MTKKTRRNVIRGVLITASLLVLVLVVHIYLVRKSPVNPDKVVMARLDIEQKITAQNANQIHTWLYNQKGVQNVLVNPTSKIAIFTYYPSKVSGESIVSNFKKALPFAIKQYIPSQKEMESGCPAIGGGIFKTVGFYIKNTF